MQTYRPAIRWWSIIVSRLIAHYTESLEVRRDRFVLRTGVFTKSETVIPFSQITNYSAEQTIFDRMYGLWYFTIETAGSITPELILSGYPGRIRYVLSQAVEAAKYPGSSLQMCKVLWCGVALAMQDRPRQDTPTSTLKKTTNALLQTRSLWWAQAL